MRLKVSGIEYIEAIAAAHAAGRKMAAFLTNYDVILSTTLAGPPLPSVIAIPGGLPSRSARMSLAASECPARLASMNLNRRFRNSEIQTGPRKAALRTRSHQAFPMRCGRDWLIATSNDAALF